MSIEDRIRDVRERISLATARHVRAQAEMESAVERRDEARKALKDEFGIDKPEDAKAKLAELNDELDGILADIEEKLEAAGA